MNIGDSINKVELSQKREELLNLLLEEEGFNIFQAESIPNRTNPPLQTHQLLVPSPKQRYTPFPLQALQQAYWVGRSSTWELNAASQFYVEFEINGLNLERLELAWQKLIEEYDVLRMIVLSDGQQQILKQVPLYQISTLDLRGQEVEVVSAKLESIRQQMPYQVFRTDQWPLFDFRATLLDEQRVRLHFKFELLILDGWSYRILMRKLAELYQNPKVTLTSLEFSFRDYVLANISLQESTAFKQAMNYWHNRIPKLFPAPSLPLAKQPSSLREYRFEHLNARLAPKIWLRFKNRAIKANLTPTLALCAAYAEVITAWSKSPRFTLTILHLNRFPLHPQVNDIVGNCSTTLLLEVDNSEEAPFEARAKRLQKQLWNDLEHSIFSGVEVVRELNRLQGSLPRATMPVTFASLVSNSSSLDGKKVPDQPQIKNFDSSNRSTINYFWDSQIYSSLQVPQVFLDHQVLEANGALIINWDFVKEIFPEEMVKDMFDAYVRFLYQLASEEDSWQKISPRLIPPAHLDLQASTNATEAPVEKNLLHTLFTLQLPQRTEQAAVVSGSLTLSYKDLYQRSNQLGNRLRQLGARPNKLVAVVMEKGWEQVVGVLAILMAGSAYLPIDPALPQERFWQLLKQSEVHLVLTQSWINKNLTWPEGSQRICVDTASEANATIQILESVQQPEDLAYVIYTSGSTGISKGVMIDHLGAVNTILDINQRFDVNHNDKVLALSSLNFDLSVYDIFGTLAAGGTIVLPDASGIKEPAHWLNLIKQEQITIWNSVPALMQLLLEFAASTEISPSELRLVLLSGDWIPLTLPSQIKALSESVQVIGLGGATEASIWSIIYPITTVDQTWTSIPYGRPMVNQQFYVLNDKLEPCPIWVPGQLYIGGRGLAKGYWKDKEKTRASFIVHPSTGKRLYRTGDLGRYLPDGNIEFLGREDFQVKVQGYRIECGEIEAILLQHSAVKAAVVTAVGEQQAAKHLVAYVVSARPEPTRSELRDFLEEKLPQYMVPSIFITLEALPLTSNGKIDRRSLPMPDPSDFTKKVSLVLPRDTLELQLAQIWSEILDVHPVGVQDNFFDLGGYSFAAMRLMARIQQKFGKTLPLETLLQGATIEHLASILRQQTDFQSSSLLVGIQSAGRKPPFFCVHPVGGNVLCYVDLARYLGKEQPFYALQSKGLNGECELLNRIEDMAAAYIESIKTIQAQGPYQLGGWSLGGIIAFEIAQQLYQQGEEVVLLAMIDSYLPTPCDKPEAIDDAMLLTSVAHDLSGIFGKDLSISVDELRQLQPEEQLNYLLKKTKMLNILPSEVGAQQMHQLLKVFKANNQAMYSYIPQIYPGRIILFCARERMKVTQVKDWEKLAVRGIEVHKIPGNHYSIIREPQVRFLADHLQGCFNGT